MRRVVWKYSSLERSQHNPGASCSLSSSRMYDRGVTARLSMSTSFIRLPSKPNPLTSMLISCMCRHVSSDLAAVHMCGGGGFKCIWIEQKCKRIGARDESRRSPGDQLQQTTTREDGRARRSLLQFRVHVSQHARGGKAQDSKAARSPAAGSSRFGERGGGGMARTRSAVSDTPPSS